MLAGLGRSTLPRYCSYSRLYASGPLVLGCGSNVVDKFFKVRALPRPGEKGFFESPTKIVEGTVVGGVTVNHLAWANLLGVPTGLLALQGTDASGVQIRKKMEEMGLVTSTIEVCDEYTTAESYVMLQTDGERSIIMASGATSLIDGKVALRLAEKFPLLCSNSIFSTEISQVPLSGVATLLEKAKEAGNLTVLDIDVTPTTAFEEAKLGDAAELKRCIASADVLKPSHIAAEELLEILTGTPAPSGLPLTEATKLLQEASGAQLVALTGGAEGCVLATSSALVAEAPFSIPGVLDATGAGDAFLGGLIAGVYAGMQSGGPSLPSMGHDDLRALARLANASGAACCRVLGGLPDGQASLDIVAGFEPRAAKLAKNSTPAGAASSSSGVAEEGALVSAQSDAASAAELARSLDVSSVVEVGRVLRGVAAAGGQVFVTGVGKSGYVGQRLAASLSSISVPSHYVHASEWAHGDLGRVNTQDAIIVVSHSGNTAECVDALNLIQARTGNKAISLVGSKTSTLAGLSSHVLSYTLASSSSEPLGGVPGTSIVLQEMVGNAVVREVIAQQTESGVDMNAVFATNHPGGSLGQKLSS